VADNFIAGAQMLFAEERAALGALTGARSFAPLDSAKTARASLSRLLAIDHVVAQIDDLRLTKLARANLLVFFEQEPVLDAESAAAVLTRAHGWVVTAPE
jgi:hypothetical protein